MQPAIDTETKQTLFLLKHCITSMTFLQCLITHLDYLISKPIEPPYHYEHKGIPNA